MEGISYFRSVSGGWISKVLRAIITFSCFDINMKVLLITEVFPPRLGGDGIHVMELALHLQKLGFEVSVLTKTCEVGSAFPFEVKRVGFKRNDLLGRVSFVVCALFEKRETDIIHAHAAVGGVIGYAHKLLYKKPLVVTVHTIWGDSLSSTRVIGIGYLLQLAEKAIFRLGFDYYITVTCEIAKNLRRWGLKRISFIPNGVNTEKFRPPGNKMRLKKKMGFGDEKILLFVGRLVKQKNVSLLLASFRLFHAKNPDSKLLIAGSGPKEVELKQEVAQAGLGASVKFLGSVDYENLPGYYQIADCLVLTSYWEGLPLCALEALATGIPIVATRVGGLPEIIRDGKNGFIAKKNLAWDIAAGIEKALLLSPAKVKAASNIVIKEYGWKTVTAKVKGVYSNIIS